MKRSSIPRMDAKLRRRERPVQGLALTRFLCASSISILITAAAPPSGPATEVFLKTRDFHSQGAATAKPAFLPLPPGAVSPKGWLRDWAQDAARGITGHLDEYSATFREAWKGHPFEARGARPDGTGWPLEQSAYWLDGAVRLAYILNDAALIEKVKKRLDAVVAGVLHGGESFIYWRPQAEALNVEFNNWAHSHVGRALVAYYQATGDPRILEALRRAYANYPLPALRSTFEDVSGSVNIDPMLDTYLMSGDRKILDALAAYSRSAAFSQVASLWAQGRVEPGHDVIFYENIRVPALLSSCGGGKESLAATLRAIEWSDKHHLLPPGVASGEEWHAGIGATRNIETCNVAASMWTYLWLLRLTGEGGYSDRIEKIFFNAGPAPADRDFQTMCYYQSPNRYSTVLPAEEPAQPGGKGSYKFTNIGHPTLCCVGNLNRVIPNYAMHMWMGTLDRGLAAALYGPSSVQAVVGDNVPLSIEADTAYPFTEAITLNVQPDRQVEFPLYLRIPSWCTGASVKVNGKRVAVDAKPGQFAKVSRTWRRGDTVSIRLPMAVRIENGRETPYPAVRYFAKNRKIAKVNSDSPYGTVQYGPLLFALPIADEGPNREAAGARFNYALDVAPGQRQAGISIERRPMPAKWNWPLSAPLQLRIPVREFDWQPADLEPLPKQFVREGRAAKVMLVPYGCTKFRVSMFPVTERAWEAGRPGVPAAGAP